MSEIVSDRIGAIFQPAFAPEEFRSVVMAAERAGLGELWLWEDCFREAAFASAGAALAWTENLRIGIGISPMPLRNVALTAMEIATLERLFPGRLLPGVGHGVLPWMGQVGARVASPLTLMSEYVPALRSLLAGERLHTKGRYVSLDDVALDWPPAVAPRVFAAGEGPKTLRLSGEVADGTVLTGGTSLDRVRDAIALINEGRDATTRGGRNEIIMFLLTAFGGDDARERMALEAQRWEFAPDSGRYVSGDVVHVADAARAFFALGVDAVILQPMSDEPDLEGFYTQAGEVARIVA
jgi:alkanesulfonate monooxygenase SsuD/methylene tetrahydromethanopterin reductase-like flavin-dependent oxidoreductase (luciferase family)